MTLTKRAGSHALLGRSFIGTYRRDFAGFFDSRARRSPSFQTARTKEMDALGELGAAAPAVSINMPVEPLALCYPGSG
jgi:hypothetical protein